MLKDMFAGLYFGKLAGHLGGDRVEPELGPQSEIRTPDPTAVSNISMFPGTKVEGVMPGASPPNSTPSPRILIAGLPPGSLLYLVLVGLVAIAIVGVFFGAGFSLLAPPAKQTIADAGTRGPKIPPPRSDPAQADRKAAPVSQETAPLQSAAVAALPGFPPTRRQAVGEAPPPQQSKATQSSPPVPPPGEPPAQTPSAPEPASISPVSPASQTGPNPFAEENAGPLGDRPAHAAQGKRSTATQGRARATAGHTRSAHHSRRLDREERAALREQQRILSAAMDRAHRENFTDAAQSSAPPRAKHRRSFDELVTQLTGESKPVDQSLTPPAPGQPDPFAQRVGNK
jgi:hypothetical protein